MQSFAFDNQNQRLFIAQIAEAGGGNDLCVNQLTLDDVLVGCVHVPDAGHGVSIGAEPVGSDTYLWTEARSSQPAAQGRGTALQRFRNVADQDPVDPQVLLSGDTNVTCATDASSQHLLVRHKPQGEFEYVLHDLAAARRGDFSAPLFPPVRPGLSGTFQGYTFDGDVLYALTGTPQTAVARYDSAISAVDLRSGTVLRDHVAETSATGMRIREPEGMAVYQAPGGARQLCLGYTWVDEDGGRRQGIYSKPLTAR